MNGNITPRPIMSFTPITTASFTIVGGAAGYIDTDVSATTGTDTTKIWVVVAKNDAFQNAGVRPLGSTADPKVAISNSATFLTTVDGTGHVDLYRAAANGGYNFIGYLS